VWLASHGHSSEGAGKISSRDAKIITSAAAT
jgi:hypothetical protein